MYVCLLNKPIELYHSTTYFAIFLYFPPDFQQRNGDTRSCACYNVYGVENVSNNSNSYNKESTCPKLTLWNNSRIYFVMTGNNVLSIFFI